MYFSIFLSFISFEGSSKTYIVKIKKENKDLLNDSDYDDSTNTGQTLLFINEYIATFGSILDSQLS